MPNPLDQSAAADNVSIPASLNNEDGSLNGVKFNDWLVNNPDAFSKISGLDTPYSEAKKTRDLIQSDNDYFDKAFGIFNSKLPDSVKEYLGQYYLNEASNKTAWERSLEADKTKYQRAVDDIKAAGLNPVQLLGGFGGSSPNAANGSVTSGSIINSKKANNALGLGIGALIMTLFSGLFKMLG